MVRKIISVWFCLLICIGGLAILSVYDIPVDFVERASAATIYVNTTGSGGAYTSIQDAIDYASDGDTVYVYGGVYFESLVVNKTISLIGEDRDTTTINCSNYLDVVTVTTDWVNITGFTIKDGDDGILVLSSSYNNITGNNVSSNHGRGIGLQSSSDYNTVTDNIASNNAMGIYLYSSSDNIITENYIASNYEYGISLGSSLYTDILNNEFVDNGLFIWGDELYHYNYHDIPTSNLVNGKPLYYFKEINNITIDDIPVGQLILVNCADIDVMNLEIENTDVGIGVAYSVNTRVIGNKIMNSYYGIYIDESSNTNITNNNASNNRYGIHLDSSVNNNFTSNIFSSNRGYGLYLSGMRNSEITDNIVSDNWRGIHLGGSENTNISGNNMLNNNGSSNGYGINLRSTSDSRIKDNNISNNDNGLILDLSSNINISGNNFANDGILIKGNKLSYYNSHDILADNTVNGKPLLVYQDESGIDITGGSIGQLILVNCTDVNVTTTHIRNTDIGLQVAYSSNMKIMKNIFNKNQFYGILLFSASNNNVSENNVSSNGHHGITLDTSSNNSIVGNIISSNHYRGISVMWSPYNSILGNNVTNNNEAIVMHMSYNNNLTGNEVSNNFNGIQLWSSSDNNIISKNVLTHNTYVYGVAISLSSSNNNTIEHNTIYSNNGSGIGLGSSSYNIVTYNDILNNRWGISAGGSYNSIYHNNLINNGNQAIDDTNNGNYWDNGYPSGGNFWSDYFGFDNFSGPDQNQIGSDGIGDTVYPIDSDSIDGYPLMFPLGELPILETSPPTISGLWPWNGSTTDDNATAIYAYYNDDSGINISSVVVIVDGIEVTSQSLVTTTGITYTPISIFEDGVHNVSLQVSDILGNIAIASWFFTVETSTHDSTPPIAEAGPDIEVLHGNTVIFNGSASTDDSGIIASYEWVSKYDNVEISLSGVNPIYTFEMIGNYEVTLIVTDPSGNTAKDTIWVNVTGIDSDDDGFFNYWEEFLGTDPTNPDSKPLDTDDDGLPDGDINNSRPWMDFDDDGDGFADEVDPDPLTPAIFDDNEPGDNSWILMIVIFLIIIIIIIAIFMVSRRRGKVPQESLDNEILDSERTATGGLEQPEQIKEKPPPPSPPLE